MSTLTVNSATLSAPDPVECIFLIEGCPDCGTSPTDPPPLNPGSVRYATGVSRSDAMTCRGPVDSG